MACLGIGGDRVLEVLERDHAGEPWSPWTQTDKADTELAFREGQALIRLKGNELWSAAIRYGVPEMTWEYLITRPDGTWSRGIPQDESPMSIMLEHYYNRWLVMKLILDP